VHKQNLHMTKKIRKETTLCVLEFQITKSDLKT